MTCRLRSFVISLAFLGLASILPPAVGAQAPTYLTQWGSTGSGAGQFRCPRGVATDAEGNIYVTDTVNNRIQKFASNGVFLTMWGSTGSDDGQFQYPYDVSTDAAGNVYVADTHNHRIQKFTSEGMFIATWGSWGTGDGELYYPEGLGADAAGNVYVADSYNERVQKFTSGGVFVTKWGSAGTGDGEFTEPIDVAADDAGNVYVEEFRNRRIQKFTSSGVFLTKWGSLGSGDGQFIEPWGISTDTAGNVFVADTGNNRIQKFTSEGVFIAKWGSLGSGDGEFRSPEGVAIGTAGYVYVSDCDNDRIQVFAPPTVAVSGMVSSDCEGPLAGVAVSLLDGNGDTHTANTNPSGDYAFTGVPSSSVPGQLSIAIPAGFVAVSPPDGTTALDLTSDQTVDFTLACIPGYTPVGSNVLVCLPGPGCDAAAVTVTFASVVGPGVTDLNSSSAGPPPPAGFRLGSPPVYFEVSTTALYGGPIDVCIDYGAIAFAREDKLVLFHRMDTGAWEQVTTTRNLDENIICGQVASLSTFAISEEVTLISLEPGPTCISTVHPCNTVSFDIARTDSEPMRAFSVTFELSAELALCSGLGSIQEKDYLSAAVGDLGNPFGTYFEVTDNGGGSYTVDGTILGEPCGATVADGTLFTVAVTNVGGDGTGTVTASEVSLRDCGNPFAEIPAMAGDPAEITIDNALPDAIASLAAAQVKSGNDADGTTVITLTWPAVEAGATVELFRKGFGFYPEYDDAGGSVPTAPADAAAALLAGWTSVGAQVSPYADETNTERDFYYYVAFVTDACGNVSAVSNRTGGTLNYHLGDVMPSAATPPFGDNQVEFLDVSFLGDHYGVSDSSPLYRNILDIGPTTDNSTNARPTTDNRIQFEDLIILAINYGMVSKPMPVSLGADRNAVALSVAPGAAGIEAVMTLSSTGAVQGVSIPLLWNAEAVEPIAVRSGELVNRQSGRAMVLSPEPGTVDAAVFGSTFSGEGELAVVTFRVIGPGDPGIRFGEVIARDGENRPIELETTVENRDLPVTPVVTRLLPSAPNPFLGSTQIRFALAEPGEAVVRVYALDGRLVRTLVDAALPAGEKSLTWDGRDELGRSVAAGTYIVQFRAANTTEAQRVMRLR